MLALVSRRFSYATIATLLLPVVLQAIQENARRFEPISIGRKQALIIGNAAYARAPLRNPINDAAAMQTVLRRLGFAVTLIENADLPHMEAGIDEFAAHLSSDSFAFVYFSGHGVQVNGSNFLLPVDFNAVSEADVKYKAYPASRLQDKLEERARLRVIVLDACRNNPFRYNRDAGGGLAGMALNVEGTLVAFGTGDHNTADDNPGQSNGLYTKELISALETPGLDLRAVFQTAKEGTYAASGRKQNPAIYDNVIGGYQLLAGAGALPGIPRVDAALEAWSAIKDSTDAGDYDEFARAFPGSELAITARFKAERLRKAAKPAAVGAVAPVPLGIEAIQNQAMELYRSGRYSEALPLFEQAAKAGDPKSMTGMAFLYEKGLGVAQNYAQANEWYRKGADGGETEAMVNLGTLYERGLGSAKDHTQALLWYQKAADAGNAVGMRWIGKLYLDGGYGVRRDYKEAMIWFRKAADAGDAYATTNVGYLYALGLGVKKDAQQAMVWYQKAADAGDARAMSNIGILYENGSGVPKNRDTAIEWYRKAAGLGFEYAIDRLKALGAAP